MSEHELHVLVARLAWTLIHFLWQGALIAGALQVVLTVMRGRTSNQRYLVRCAALGLVALAPVVTFTMLGAETTSAVALPSMLLVSEEPLVTGTWASWFASGDLLPWVALVWSLGAAFFSVRLAGGCWQVWRLRRRALGIALAPRWQRRFETIARDFGTRAGARVVECAAVSVPTVIGWVKPVVFLPARIFTGLTDEQIEALIAHELAHVSRHDYLVNLVQSVLEALLFYHPAVWWISRGIRIEREYCCDDLAVAATHDGLAYAHALTALESWRSKQPQMGVSTLGGSLMQRIQRLVGIPQATKPGPLRPLHSLAALLVAGSMGASAFGLAALPEPTPGDDCPCACHKNKHQHTQRKIQKNVFFEVPEVRVLTGNVQEWTGQAPEWREVRRHDARFPEKGPVRIGDELVEYERLKGELVQLRETIAQVRGEIHDLVGEVHGEPQDADDLWADDLWKVTFDRVQANQPRRIVEGHRGSTSVDEKGSIEAWSPGEGQSGHYLELETRYDPDKNLIYVSPRIRQRYVERKSDDGSRYSTFEWPEGEEGEPQRRQVFSIRISDGKGATGYLSANEFREIRAQKAVEEVKELEQIHLQRLYPDLPKGAYHGFDLDEDALIELKELKNLKEYVVRRDPLGPGQVLHSEDLPEGLQLHLQEVIGNLHGVHENVELEVDDLHREHPDLLLRKIHEGDEHAPVILNTEKEIQELVGNVEIDLWTEGAEIELDVQDLVEQIKVLVEELRIEEVVEDDD